MQIERLTHTIKHLVGGIDGYLSHEAGQIIKDKLIQMVKGGACDRKYEGICSTNATNVIDWYRHKLSI